MSSTNELPISHVMSISDSDVNPQSKRKISGSIICCVVFSWVQICLMIGIIFLVVLISLEGNALSDSKG